MSTVSLINTVTMSSDTVYLPAQPTFKHLYYFTYIHGLRVVIAGFPVVPSVSMQHPYIL